MEKYSEIKIKDGILDGPVYQYITSVDKVNDLVTNGMPFREAYQEILKQHHLQDEEVAYIGDDLHDFPVLKRVGLALSVANGREEVKEIADYITKRGGGQGAVREAVEIILKAQGKWEEVTRQYKVPA